MNRLACKYSVIQFLPYPETGEFANVGILLACDKTNLLDFRLETRKAKRYTAFFQNLEAQIFRLATKQLSEEFRHVRNEMAHGLRGTAGATFETITRPRETMLRFGAPRVVLTEDPQKELDSLFEHYVLHGFAKEANYEAELERRVKQLLQDLNLRAPFKPAKVGNDLFAVQFPLVQTLDGKPSKVIKPFFLGQATPGAIYQHGDQWLAKLARLKNMGLMPENILFALKGPALAGETQANQRKAFEDIRQDLANLVIVTDARNGLDTETIRDFVAH